MGVLVIAEPGMTWDRKLEDAYRLIDAAKACGADVCKFQWTSSGRKIQERRKVDPKYIAIYEHGVQYPREWLEKLKGHCDQVGIEFMATTYLIEDIGVVEPLVKRFKISAYEAKWRQFVEAHVPYRKDLIISTNPGRPEYHTWDEWMNYTCHYDVLHCISEYPTPIEHVGLSVFHNSELPNGLSDHTANVLTGAAAVAAGARIVEAHIRLMDTDPKNPDYGHSLVADDPGCSTSCGEERCKEDYPASFRDYVYNIRQVEKML